QTSRDFAVKLFLACGGIPHLLTPNLLNLSLNLNLNLNIRLGDFDKLSHRRESYLPTYILTYIPTQAPPLLQLVNKGFFELFHLWFNHHLTIRLTSISFKIILVVILRRIEIRGWGNL